ATQLPLAQRVRIRIEEEKVRVRQSIRVEELCQPRRLSLGRATHTDRDHWLSVRGSPRIDCGNKVVVRVAESGAENDEPSRVFSEAAVSVRQIIGSPDSSKLVGGCSFGTRVMLVGTPTSAGSNVCLSSPPQKKSLKPAPSFSNMTAQ